MANAPQEINVVPAPSPSAELEAFAEALRAVPGIAEAQSDDLSRYSMLPYCVLAAVFSINARYAAVRNAVRRYRKHYKLPSTREADVLPGEEELTITQFIGHIDEIGAERFAREVLKNEMRTSTTSGILKAQAARDYAQVLQARGIERKPDVLAYADQAELETALRKVHGQSSGISTDYFFMNVGDTTRVKPDRWILGFLAQALGRKVTLAEAYEMFRAVVPLLTEEYPGITPRALDLAVWKALSEKGGAAVKASGSREALERQIAFTEARLVRLRKKLAQVEGDTTPS